MAMMGDLTDAQKETMHVHGFSPQLVLMVQSCIDQANKGELAPNTAYEDIWTMLQEKNIVSVKTLTPEKVACHPSNRGSLGINGYNAHRNGLAVDSAGCDLKELGKAACFERCPLEPMRSFQLDFNQKMITNAKGLLADLSGREEAMSVGTGHWTAWCRAVNFGCKTPFKQMANTEGKLSADRFKAKDKRMKVCLEEGWEWRWFPWQTEVAWPKLPALVQRALNSSHQVTSRSTELEVMVSAMEAAREDQSGSEDFKNIMQSLALSGPACAHYITFVGELGLQIGGGQTSPVLFFLDRFSKIYGENKLLGEEFIKSVVSLSVSKVDKLQFFKAALVATNTSSDKIVDGISKLIVKSDVDKCKSNARIPLVKEIDAAVATARH